jgi:hypothetical protein
VNTAGSGLRMVARSYEHNIRPSVSREQGIS